MSSVVNWSQLQMPGFNVPLNFQPQENVISGAIWGFPNALDPNHLEYGSLDELITHREIIMMQIMNIITDKADWDRKVYDEHITAKWREEVSQNATPKMMDWIIKELQWKAGILEKTGFVEVFDVGVLKSDTAISKELQAALKEAVVPLENVPEDQKDYHPGSDKKVVDLVHPSLFPVIYGRTHVLPDRVIGLDDCLDSIGEGELLPSPSKDEAIPGGSKYSFQRSSLPPVLSTKFQWLPCDVEITEDGGCRILSYINNAHPVEHRALYEVIERILAQTMSLWEKTLTERPFEGERIVFREVEYEEDSEPGPAYPEDPNEDFDEVEYEERLDAWSASRQIKLPEPGEFKIKESLYEDVNFQKHFPDNKFQVIVKLANIELTPDKPDYEGGTWHIEGQLNERIAASAIYYYDSENITPSSLAFRHRGMSDMWGVSYEQDRHQFLQQVYGFPEDIDGRNDGLITQELGSVASKEGRLITFPNTLQHRVSPFSLADHSKPGHRKILALFLVDPHTRIISSANAPPQREDWRRKKQDSVQDVLSQNLHPEAPKVMRGLTVDSTLTMEEAKAHRLELMEERGLRAEEHNSAFQEGAFSLCEH